MVKKILTILTSALMVLAAFAGGGVSSLLTATPVMAQDGIASGTDGTCAWTLDASGKLTIGDGTSCSLDSHDSGDWSWLEYKVAGIIPITGFIQSVEINGTVTTGENAFLMFSGLSSCTSIDLTGLDTSSTEAMAQVFSCCSSLEEITLPADFASSASKIYGMFEGCTSLTSLELPTSFGSSAADMGGMFHDCTSLEHLVLSNYMGGEDGSLVEELELDSNLSFYHTKYIDGTSTGDSTLYTGEDMLAMTPAQLAGTWSSSLPPFSHYASVAGDNDIPLNKYLVLAEDAQVPNATFSFSIAAGTGVPASTGIQEVLAPTATNGVTGTPSIASISFSASDTASMTDAADSGVTLSAGQEYVKKTTYVDFSNTSFVEPGIYRYVITESGDNEVIFNMDAQKGAGATAKQRILDVYVTDANDGTNVLEISEYVLHEIADNVPAGSDKGTGYATLPITDKSVGYVNVFLSQNLAVANKTDGNQGSRDKYFAYAVALTGLQGEKAYDVDISNADAEVASTAATAQGYRGNSNPTSLTSLANGSASGTFYLRDDQNIEIKGLPVGVGYTVTAVAEDYKQTAGATITAGTFTDSATGTIASADINTGYTHTRNGVIPTGIAVSAAGTIAIAGMAMAGLLAKRKREDEE